MILFLFGVNMVLFSLIMGIYFIIFFENEYILLIYYDFIYVDFWYFWFNNWISV